MTRFQLARWLALGPALVIVLVPPLADFNASHVTNEHWTAHARLHTVWLVVTNSAIALGAVALLWRSNAESLAGFRLGSVLVAAILGGFFVAAATASSYGGALTDPNGVALSFGPLDANLVVFTLCAFSLAAAQWLVRAPKA